MTDQQQQHCATPEQWLAQEEWASPPDLDPYALCLIELRDRIAALEAAPTFRVLETGEPICMNIVQDEASGQNILVPPTAPADSLVERVSSAIDQSICPDQWLHMDAARAAIREVARWLRSELVSRAVADRLEQEADR
jgi:hypothetical protein